MPAPITPSRDLGPAQTPSIFKKRAASSEAENDAAQSPNEQVLKPKATEAFDADKLKLVWEAFIDQRKNKASDMEQLILHRELQKQGAHDVVIILRSTLEISILERFEHDLIAYLRQELKNDQILLHKEVQEEEQQSKKLYTSADKYEYMAQQNPSLKLLKERLGLDFEY